MGSTTFEKVVKIMESAGSVMPADPVVGRSLNLSKESLTWSWYIKKHLLQKSYCRQSPQFARL